MAKTWKDDEVSLEPIKNEAAQIRRRLELNTLRYGLPAAQERRVDKGVLAVEDDT